MEERPVTNYIIHPLYENYYFDVALILLEEPLIFTPRIQPLCLPSKAENSSDVMHRWGLKVQGWSPNDDGRYNKLLILTEIVVNVR